MSDVLSPMIDLALDLLTIYYSDVKLLVGELDFGVYVRRHKAKMRRKRRPSRSAGN